MNLSSWRKSIPNKYSQLLSTLIVLFLLAPILEEQVSSILLPVVFLVTIISIIRTFNIEGKFLFLLLILTGTAFSVDAYTKLQVNYEPEKLLVLLVETIYSLFVLAALVVINRQIFAEKKVTADTLKGGISIFLLLGIFWGLIFRLISLLEPNAFSSSGETNSVLDSMFYFSYTTLTTLGYGDITPVSRMARNLANLAAITGMLYPSIFIARLVGLYTAQEMSQGD